MLIPEAQSRVAVWLLLWLGVALLALLLLCDISCSSAGLSAEAASSPPHNDNWAVIVSTSMYWYNYRHATNALVFYHAVKRLGIPDSHIILMLADDHPCDERNRDPGTLFLDRNHNHCVYDESVSVDYRGAEVTAENFIRVMTGRTRSDTPASRQLRSSEKSNLLLYMTGHGGVDFLKFRDTDIISSTELADTFSQMKIKKRFHRLLFVLDTCHAESLFLPIKAPGIVGISSSAVNEDSYGIEVSSRLGTVTVDEFTGAMHTFLQRLEPPSKLTLRDMYQFSLRARLRSHPRLYHTDAIDPTKVLVTDFLANARETIDLSDGLAAEVGCDEAGDACKQRVEPNAASFTLFPTL